MGRFVLGDIVAPPRQIATRIAEIDVLSGRLSPAARPEGPVQGLCEAREEGKPTDTRSRILEF